MFHSYFERKNAKILTFNIVHFPNFDMSASFYLAPPSNKCQISLIYNLISAEGTYKKKYGIQSNYTKLKTR